MTCHHRLPGLIRIQVPGNLRIVFGDGEESCIGDGTGESIEMRIHKAMPGCPGALWGLANEVCGAITCGNKYIYIYIYRFNL